MADVRVPYIVMQKVGNIVRPPRIFFRTVARICHQTLAHCITRLLVASNHATRDCGLTNPELLHATANCLRKTLYGRVFCQWNIEPHVVKHPCRRYEGLRTRQAPVLSPSRMISLRFVTTLCVIYAVLRTTIMIKHLQCKI